jgi:hydrogenase maturation protease
MPRTAVLGLGNVLMGDDGFGPYLARALEAEWEFPPDAAVHDLGTPGLDLAPWLAGVDLVVVLDAVAASGAPGDVRTYSRHDLFRRAPSPRLGPHDPGLREALLSAELAGIAPRELLVVGVVPQRVAPGPGLSDVVRAAVPAAVETVVRLLGERGCRLERRRAPLCFDPWWEAPPPGATVAPV